MTNTLPCCNKQNAFNFHTYFYIINLLFNLLSSLIQKFFPSSNENFYAPLSFKSAAKVLIINE